VRGEQPNNPPDFDLTVLPSKDLILCCATFGVGIGVLGKHCKKWMLAFIYRGLMRQKEIGKNGKKRAFFIS
jgi:hypothetical protein